MQIKLGIIAAGCALSLTAGAGTMGEPKTEYRPWSVIGSLGYTWNNSAYNGKGERRDFDDSPHQTAIGDGQTAFGRFAIARDLWSPKTLHLGLEVGVQSGNTIRLGIPQHELDELGGLPVQATIKPMLDLLATGTWQPMESPVLEIVKLGVVYRRMQINDRFTFNDLSQAAFEVQAGLGAQISDRATVSLNYQGIFNGSTNYRIDWEHGVGHISNIPNQNGLLLSLSYTV